MNFQVNSQLNQAPLTRTQVIARVNNGIKALSVQSPWSWLIIHGGKDVENRSWATNYRGPLLIHVGKTVDTDGFEFAADLGVTVPKKPSTGGIVGVVDLVDVRESAESPWYMPGQFAWMLANPRPTEFIPCRGRLSLFKPELGD